jgi:hypothetical protein
MLMAIFYYLMGCGYAAFLFMVLANLADYKPTKLDLVRITIILASWVGVVIATGAIIISLTEN